MVRTAHPTSTKILNLLALTPTLVIEIPAKLARHLKLDDGRSWIKTHQINTVEWEQNRLPFGVVPAHKGQWVFGQLPQSIGKQVFEQVKANIDRKHLRNVRR